MDDLTERALREEIADLQEKKRYLELTVDGMTKTIAEYIDIVQGLRAENQKIDVCNHMIELVENEKKELWERHNAVYRRKQHYLIGLGKIKGMLALDIVEDHTHRERNITMRHIIGLINMWMKTEEDYAAIAWGMDEIPF